MKPNWHKFEAFGIVRDGSESTSAKKVYKKGYHVTEACVLTSSNHPASIFSQIHSSSEKGYKSANEVTFHVMEQGVALFGKVVFAMDRGCDDNKMFQFQNFRVRKLCVFNALNFYITLCMAFLALLSMAPETNELKVSIVKTADHVKKFSSVITG